MIPTVKVTIQRATSTRQTDGTYSEVWADLSEPNLHIRQLSGKEVEENKKLGFNITHRWYDFTGTLDVTAKDRIVHNSDVFEIIRVDNPHWMGNHKQIDTRIIKDDES